VVDDRNYCVEVARLGKGLSWELKIVFDLNEEALFFLS
jgi:hypothetical protein